ncbi:MAG: hypothetical protein AAFO96_16450 [Bacteroidota bacterium]
MLHLLFYTPKMFREPEDYRYPLTSQVSEQWDWLEEIATGVEEFVRQHHQSMPWAEICQNVSTDLYWLRLTYLNLYQEPALKHLLSDTWIKDLQKDLHEARLYAMYKGDYQKELLYGRGQKAMRYVNRILELNALDYEAGEKDGFHRFIEQEDYDDSLIQLIKETLRKDPQRHRTFQASAEMQLAILAWKMALEEELTLHPGQADELYRFTVRSAEQTGAWGIVYGFWEPAEQTEEPLLMHMHTLATSFNPDHSQVKIEDVLGK